MQYENNLIKKNYREKKKQQQKTRFGFQKAKSSQKV